MNDSHRQVILVTGSTDGLGRRMAEMLGRAGHTVLIHGRDGPRADAVAKGVQAAGGHAATYLADFSSLAEVRRFAQALVRDRPVIDVVIHNAGIGFGHAAGARELSRDGYELRLAVNYLAPFLLSYLLLPALAAGRGRIVNVASVGQAPIDFSDLMLTQGWRGERAYRQSKLALIMATFDLAQALRTFGVTVNALHPASFMPTTMVRESGVAPLSTIEEGAGATVHLATSPQVAAYSGLFFDGTRPARAHAQAYDIDARARLRALSYELVRLGHRAGFEAPGTNQPGAVSIAPAVPSADVPTRN